MIDEIFEVLRKNGFTDATEVKKAIGRLSPAQLTNLDEALSDALAHHAPSTANSSISSFDFWPNSDLSASVGGCEEMACRVRRIDRLSRFAVMWADTVYIPTYFGNLMRDPEHPLARSWLTGSIATVLRAEPCLRAGIMRIAADSYHVCPTCQTDIEPTIGQVRTRLAQAELAIAETYRSGVDATFEGGDGHYEAEITAPDDLIPHGGLYVSYYPPHDELPDWLPAEVKRAALAGKDANYHVPSRGRGRKTIVQDMLHPIVEDIVSQRLSCCLYGTKYLTHRPIDATLLEATNESPAFRDWTSVLSQYMEYEMPLLTGVSIEDLLDLRQQNYDAFNVYRDSIKHVISEYVAKRPVLTGKEASEVYDDFVQPELNRMNLRLKSVRDKLTKRTRDNIVVAMGTVALGLSSGLLAPELAISAAGASPFLANAAKQLLEKTHASEELASENFYFLWKASGRAGKTKV